MDPANGCWLLHPRGASTVAWWLGRALLKGGSRAVRGYGHTIEIGKLGWQSVWRWDACLGCSPCPGAACGSRCPPSPRASPARAYPEQKFTVDVYGKRRLFFFKMSCGIHSWFSLCLFTSDRVVKHKEIRNHLNHRGSA